MPRKPMAWVKPQMVGLQHDPDQMPTPRSGYSLTLVGVNGYCFGGLDSQLVPPQASNDLFCVRMSDEVCEWKRMEVPPKDPKPLPRWRHTATQISATAILVFGGFHSHDERLNDTWIFDTITLSWTRYDPRFAKSTSSPGSLQASSRHACACAAAPVVCSLACARRACAVMFVAAPACFSWACVVLQARGGAPRGAQDH